MNIDDQVRKLLLDIEDKFNVTLYLASIHGKRWEFISGTRTREIPLSQPFRISISEEMGLVIYGWYELDDTKKREIESLISDIRHG
ncbi:MAG: hypothetical protein JXA60_10375 [Candidatus Coatesbacteria bacterium]|nr:hypothetical protein [Candidatus Coatesbacteria bacterium]